MEERSEYGFVAIANELLLRFQLPVITNLSECTSHMFVALYEGILGEKHPYTVSVRNKQDELTNVQVIINTLARDVLHADLSHISGQAIIDGDDVTIRYLLEIFMGLMEYVMEQITSGASSDAEDDVSAHDPDILTQGTISTISDILQEELGSRDHSYGNRSRNMARPRQRLKQSDISLPSTISNIESHYDSEYSSDSTIELPENALARNTVTILPQDALARNAVTFQDAPPVAGRLSREQDMLPSTTTAEQSLSARRQQLAGKGQQLRAPRSSRKEGARATEQSSMPSRLPPSRATDAPSMASHLPSSRAAWTTSMTTEVPARATALRASESDSEGEKIRQRVLENESIEKLRRMQQQRTAGTDVDSTQELSRGSADIEQNAHTNGNLQVEEVSSSLASTSPPSVTKHPFKRPGMMTEKLEENAFASLGVRPKPASHPHFWMDHQQGNLDSMNTTEDARVRRHLHTHHHFHVSDDWHLPERSTNIDSRTAKASHTITRPPPDDDEGQIASTDKPRSTKASHTITHPPTEADEDQIASTSRDDFRSRDIDSRLGRPGYVASRVNRLRDGDSRLGRPRDTRYMVDDDISSRLPLPKHTALTKDRHVGYNLRSHQKDEPSARISTTLTQRKVAFACDDHDEFDDENKRMNDNELDKETILKQLKERLIDSRSKRRIAGESSDDTDSDISDISLHSDSIVDYHPSPQAKRYRVYSPKRDNKPKSSVVKPVLKKNHVHFDDALDVEGKGQFGKIRRSIKKEGAGHEKKTKAMKEVYATHLEQLQTGQKELIDKKKKAAQLLDKKYRQIHQIPKMKRYSAANKYTTSSDNRERSKVKGHLGKRKRSASSSPILVRNRRPFVIEDDEMLPTVMSEFPMLHVSPHTAHNMWSKQMRQLEQLTKSGFNQSRKTKTQKKMEEAEKRQELLLGIMRKELAHNRRMKDIKEKREHEKAMKTKIQEQRQTTARARRYYDQFKVRASARMLKRKTREEQIFKKLFEDGLQIQKNRVRELRKYAKEKREEMATQQQNEIESLENYYSNQFAMLAEAIGQERHDLLVRDNAQAKVMAKMKRELRRKMETEIHEFQENLYNDEDREYFRQVEADRMKRELQMAAYKTSL